MKKTNFILQIVLMLAFSLYAIPSVSRLMDPQSKEVYQEDRMKIKLEELPQAARKTLSGDAFKGWTVGGCFKTKAGLYEVELKKEDAVQTVKFDKTGKVM